MTTATPSRMERFIGVVRWIFVALSFVAAAATWTKYFREEQSGHGADARPRYHCPMHPQITSPDPGECPICHMDLEPIPETRAAASIDPSDTKLPPGTSEVSLSIDRIQATGVRSTAVIQRARTERQRVVATLAAAERGAAEVHARTPGFVEYVGVSESGNAVKRGQLVAAIYSPEAFQAQTELIAATKFGEAGKGTVDAARTRLELLGMGSTEIDRVIASGKPARTIGLSAPIAGVVSKKNVVLGSYVTPETSLFEIVDLSTILVLIEVPQSSAEGLKVGSTGALFVGARTGEGVPIKIDLIYPQLDAAARTVRARATLKNDGAMKPGQSGTVELDATNDPVAMVPRDAVVDTGRTTYVFVDLGDGKFSPRIVKLGASSEDLVEVRSGVVAGEKVVCGATFLVDAESRLRASFVQGAQP